MSYGCRARPRFPVRPGPRPPPCSSGGRRALHAQDLVEEDTVSSAARPPVRRLAAAAVIGLSALGGSVVVHAVAAWEGGARGVGAADFTVAALLAAFAAAAV